MVVLLILCGALAGFGAGWAAARAVAQRHAVVAPPPLLPTPSAADTMLADVLERHATGVVVTDASGAIVYRNPAARALVGTHVGVIVDEAVGRHVPAAAAGVSSGETLELYGPPKRVVVVTSQPLGAGRTVAFVDDISERRRADQARTDFVANVSHELRTPIGALTVLAETLVGVGDPDVIERVVARMQGEADRAARTIDDLLELSKIESGVDRDVAEVKLSDFVGDAVSRSAELAAASGITISVLDPLGPDIPVELQATVRGDRRQLASALGNLVENAVKYSESGDVVQIRVRRAGDVGEISVVDEGVGIPHSDLDRIFERFYRVDRARSRSTGGTGLGLSIVRHVASSHGGTVSVESIEGEGSTFVLRLPLVDADSGGDDERDDGHVDEHEGVA